MAKRAKRASETTPIEQYEHTGKTRVNNPPVGLVTARSDNGGVRKRRYAFDPHIDPKLDWCGKAEHTSFEVPTVSLHVHERIDPRRIVEELRREPEPGARQSHLFESDVKPLRQAVEFYKHTENWSNRLVAGDSVLVMNSLLEKEAMAGKVQMVYFDPPYGIKYGSNFQPFVNKRDVKDGKDEDLTAEPEMIKAFRDTWELGIHSYLTYIRDRLQLARELLHESGSVFVQISDENVHRIRCVMDEVFGAENFCALITFRKKMMPLGSDVAEGVSDYILWYSKKRDLIKSRPLFKDKEIEGDSQWKSVDLPSGERRQLTQEEWQNHRHLPPGSKIFQAISLLPAQYRPNQDFVFEYDGIKYKPPKDSCWKTDLKGMKSLAANRRLVPSGSTLRYVLYINDYPVSRITNLWADTAGADDIKYVVQTNTRVIQRCMLMTTDPGDLVLDITCGSGTTAYVAENWGRRWITCDTSRVALTLAKQRLMTAKFDYFELAHPSEGVGSGFRYKSVPHVTLKSIANNEPAPEETLYDQPYIDKQRIRVTGPFTVEAVPAPSALMRGEERGARDEESGETLAPQPSPLAPNRSGETIRQSDWKDELLRSGVRGKGKNRIEFTRVESLTGTKYLQAEAETKEKNPQRVVVCFGPEHAPLEQRMVELALEEAQHLKPTAQIILFCAFQFDEEAAKDIDETNWPGVTLLKAQMNADLQTHDLKKKQAGNDSFWLIGQPDVKRSEIKKGEHKGKSQVEVLGFDYYDPKIGDVISGGQSDIAMWMLDTDYDGRSLYPVQVFFPMSGEKDGWSGLAKNLKAELDEEKLEAFRGTVSLPFTPGKAVAVKIIDDRGIESLKIFR
jgi:adenine-specific DNA-methyltransferase